mmetsp:Transcript_44038/g.139771  ORF Transcript_44038/g.139771 Transcript_44038/m.139771 type:complete len:249 (-) Transcript_44038:251-997(-)
MPSEQQRRTTPRAASGVAATTPRGEAASRTPRGTDAASRSLAAGWPPEPIPAPMLRPSGCEEPGGLSAPRSLPRPALGAPLSPLGMSGGGFIGGGTSDAWGRAPSRGTGTPPPGAAWGGGLSDEDLEAARQRAERSAAAAQQLAALHSRLGLNSLLPTRGALSGLAAAAGAEGAAPEAGGLGPKTADRSATPPAPLPARTASVPAPPGYAGGGGKGASAAPPLPAAFASGAGMGALLGELDTRRSLPA